MTSHNPNPSASENDPIKKALEKALGDHFCTINTKYTETEIFVELSNRNPPPKSGNFSWYPDYIIEEAYKIVSLNLPLQKKLPIFVY